MLSSPSAARRRSAVMFNDYVILHTPPSVASPPLSLSSAAAAGVDKSTANTVNNTTASSTSTTTTVASNAEKMTQTAIDAQNTTTTIWQVNLPNQAPTTNTTALADCSDLALNEALTCQELLAFSVAFSAALPTNQTTLETFYSSLNKADASRPLDNATADNVAAAVASAALETTTKNGGHTNSAYSAATATTQTAATVAAARGGTAEDFSCCIDLYLQAKYTDGPTALMRRSSTRPRSPYVQCMLTVWHMIAKVLGFVRKGVRRLVEQKYFQQGILLAILINTLSMGIEYHNQPEELTAIVETSNIVFSVIFACEMLLKVVAEGPFRYVANGFNVFDGVIVILRWVLKSTCLRFYV